MGIKSHYLEDSNGNKFYPYAHANATFDSNGVKVGTRLDEIDKNINSVTTDIDTHINNNDVHITDTERTNWNDANSKKHTHSNKTVLDNTTASFTTDEKEKLSGIDEKANNYTLPFAGTSLGGVKTGGDVIITDGVITVNDDSHAHIISNVDGLQSVLDAKVPTTRTVNGKALSSDITLSSSDVGAEPSGSVDIGLANAKSYTDTKISNIVGSTSVSSQISSHNTSTSAHNDIRTLISDLTTKVNNFLDVDDTTTDQLSEVITLIENNKGTLESLTTSKVNLVDIIDNLTTANVSKVLSANQGVVIKGLIDTLQSELDSHTHAIADVSGLQSALDGKASTSHGTHVSYSTTVPVMDGTASVGSASTVARSDHKHPTDTSRASASDLISHTENATSHITSTERTNWNSAKTHADSAHAPSNAEKNQHAFSNVKVGDTTVSADTTTDTLTLVAGDNITITPDVTNDKITISSIDTVYTHPSYTSKSSGLYKITVDTTGHISAATAVAKSDITALGIPSSDTNTHYTSKNVIAGSSTATSDTTSALSNGSVYLISVENGAVTSSHKITGSGATTVTTDASGNIVINSTDTNTVYTHPTTSGNKHIPSGGSSGQILKWGSSGTAVWGTNDGISEIITETNTEPSGQAVGDYWTVESSL